MKTIVLTAEDFGVLLSGGTVSRGQTSLQLENIGIDLAVSAIAGVLKQRFTTPYFDARYPRRRCDHCGEEYQGPAVYCGLSCALEDAI